MELRLNVSAEDDAEILEALQEQARLCRRRGTPQAAVTAAKVELLFSRAIDEIRATPASEEAEQ